MVLGGVLSFGCPDRWLDDPPPPPPPPACEPGFVLDPRTGSCVDRGCRSDDDCLPGQRCELIDAVCIPADEPATVAVLGVGGGENR